MTPITRRKFAVLLGVAGLGMVVPAWAEAHVESRRLMRFAEGSIKLAGPERSHLHECKECQTVLCLLTRLTDPS